MRVLQGYEPAAVLGFFEDICGIPHISGHEQAISDFCVAFAKERGLAYEQDELGNVIIFKDATEGYEGVEPIIIQGHLDMVGDKVPECPLNLEKDAIQIMVDGDFITANGTTLGADNGIAVAYGLALLDAKDIPHPRLEVVLTVSEEVGLDGATAIDLSSCKARRLINVDSESEGIFTAGCAGGLRAKSVIPVGRETVEGTLFEVKTTGFLGGHSGIEIDKARANANVMLGRFFMNHPEFRMVAMQGGVKDNVIPKNAAASFVAVDADAVKAAVDELNQIIANEYAATDADAAIVLEVKEAGAYEALDAASQVKAVTALNVMPNGVQTMSADLPGLVETSLNMGVVELDAEAITLTFSVRSSVATAKDYTYKKLEQLTTALDGTITSSGEYPGWPYARNSKLRDLCIKVYEEQYGKTPEVEIIHAGLECGILSSKIEGLDCISMGPDMFDVHTPDERVSMSSVARVWEYLKAVLACK